MRRAVLTAILLAPAAAMFAQQPELGAPLDPALFAFQRTIPDGRPGAVALVVDPLMLAHSRGPSEHFADVRILDGSRRQVPYVVEHRDDPLIVALTPERSDPPASPTGAVKRSNWSSYRLQLPSANLPASQVAIETSARVFQRGVQLAVLRPADRHSRNARLEIIAATTWGHVDSDTPASALTLSVMSGDASELWLSIDEGDNSRLPITAVRLLLPSYRLRFYRPARSSLSLVYGRSDLLAPRYDLALVSNDLLTTGATEVTPLAERHTQPARRSLVSPLQFWVFLSIAVITLLALIVRLTRQRANQF
ncbi:MAG TPA: hypothetical protein VL882_22365 [Vicinamibacterales bacterium]|jgi:hypothetical protein|nr:hypothetical protein [Vicinamibacterales bacterium]